jgi:hypothetical protein
MVVIHKEDGEGCTLVGTTPTVYNKSMPSQNTEYSQALPAKTKRFIIQARGAHDIKLCYTALGSGTLYLTVKSGSSYEEKDLDIGDDGITLYMQSTSNTVVAEIIGWV